MTTNNPITIKRSQQQAHNSVKLQSNQLETRTEKDTYQKLPFTQRQTYTLINFIELKFGKRVYVDRKFKTNMM